ncbi:isoprenylcysteine carboxylmethyltransferase family protein [Bacillus sp. DTU_2020_1000418_1_SI_GHA_SEK_038]|uniref:isoprenylcysteine carboxyl methyltransferase family protein n=1 Tax=Bacillus sp. DTU_2020_1000418_1_SI_GHA_SEK_038 TaxID=3077585 RepID=UPI0028E6FF15|nr:isoprenylcysteine carboxylmethyltransferase family protein [Bacillus sp. DTU_2020_1000418_1_SI_GHA_SEK_038]WNS73964.1 isoprenylcysteine carboxylmethyltransferase family protein [Bacillus sp. DTU_2020_1000418_1_SI_GHA_SEK_038]
MVFTIFIAVIIIQRIAELSIAKKNERFMKSQGALEFGQLHYPFIVAVHSLFFVSYIMEVSLFGSELSSYWPILLPLFLLTQAGRIWALKSLGPYWNTKIIVLPNARIIRKGPYRYIKHPNYVIVAAEFLIIPLMFEAYLTTALFTILNIIILAIRIPAEENALKKLTAYEQAFSQRSSLSKI